MAIGERFRSGGARGIARFLSDHQHCENGFDVQREPGPGTGQLMITCKGCGASIAYKAAEAGELAAGAQVGNGTPPPTEASDPPPKAPVRPRPSTAGSPAPPPGGDARRLRERKPLPRWVAPVVIGGVIAVGALMIVLGLNRTGGNGTTEETTATSTPTQTTPTEPAPTETAPTQTTPAPAPEPPADKTPNVRLKRATFADAFAIGVPAGWRDGSRDNALSLTPPGDVAEIRVFLEPGDDSTAELVRGASGFLASEHRGAQVSKPQNLQLGRSQAKLITATYGGGEESAAVLTAGGYTFLVLRRVDNGASPRIAADAEASLKSFRAKR